MTPEQLPEVIRRMQKNACIIKREREEEEISGNSSGGPPNHWEDKVEYMRTKSVKRQRQRPTENDELVYLEREE